MGTDRYRRTVAVVRMLDGHWSISLGDALIREGLGVQWNNVLGPNPNPWCGQAQP